MRLKLKIIAGLAGSLLLAACDSSDSGDDTAEGISAFGPAFVSMFETSPNGDPVDAQGIDIVINPTGDPFNP